MREEFPPLAQQPSEIELVLEAFSCVVHGRTAIYVSSPLTTGQRAFEWRLRNGAFTGATQHGEGEAFRREVVEPNRREAAAYAVRLRESTHRVVIDPTALPEAPGWNQSDFRALWGRIIDRYADSVVFRDGWQYSSGCGYEFLVGCESGARLLREDLKPLVFEEGRSLIGRGIKESHERGASAVFLERVLQALEELAARS